MRKKQLITRRQALITGVTSLGALILPGCSKPLPPTYGNILRMGDVLTYAAHRALLPGQSLVKEYSFKDISSFPATGTINPAVVEDAPFREEYDRLQRNSFADYRLVVDGNVAKPGSFSLEDIQKFPARKQITKHLCEEGWSAIAEWTGVPLGSILNAVGINPSARYVNLHAFDGYIDNIDLVDAFHPQTILAYGMNGRDLLVQHGAPIRMRIETQIGYKSLKFLKRIEVTDTFLDQGDNGWAWYVGI